MADTINDVAAAEQVPAEPASPVDQQRAALDGLASTTAYLFGRRTYEKMASFWPTQPNSNPLAAHLNATVKYVATRTHSRFTWPNTERLDGDLHRAVRELKSWGEGNIAVLGSGVLVSELMGRDLVDGYRIFLHPLLLGTGKRMFRELPQPKPLRLTGSSTTTTEVVLLTYEPGAARTSSGAAAWALRRANTCTTIHSAIAVTSPAALWWMALGSERVPAAVERKGQGHEGST